MAELTAVGSGAVRWSTGATDSQISVRASGTYSVTLTGANGSKATASTEVTTDQTSPVLTLSPGSATVTCASPSAVLTASGTGSLRWSTGSTEPQITVSTGGMYSVTLTAANGCTATTSINVEGNTSLGTPTLVTQSGQSNVTVDLNPAPVTLLASGCAGTINWTGSNNTAGMGTTPARYVHLSGVSGELSARGLCQLASQRYGDRDSSCDGAAPGCGQQRRAAHAPGGQ